MTRRRLLRLLAAATVLVAGGLTVWLLLPPSELERLRAELDATDPGWRFADIRATRLADQPPPAENVVHVMTAAARLIPPGFEAWAKDERTSSGLARQARPAVRPDGVAAWRAAAEAVAVARRAAGLPGGTADTPVPDDPFQYPRMRYAADAQRVAQLLQADAALAGRHGDPAGAVASVRSILAIARGLGRDPFMTDFDYAHGLQAMAVVALWRALATAEPPAAALAAVAGDLRAAAEPAAFISHLRDWRAVEDLKLSAVAAGRVHMDNAGVLRAHGRYNTPNLVGRMDYRLRSIGTDHAGTLAHLTRLIRIAGRPPEEWQEAVAAVPLPPDDIRHRYTGQVAGYTRQKFAVVQQRLALLRAASVAVACEEYRLRHGRWPDSLADLAPADAADPYTGRPLHLKRLPDGLTVYSVGPDGQDDGGRVFDAAIFLGQVRGGADVGFRIWDVAARGRPAGD